MKVGLISFAWTEEHTGGLKTHARDLATNLSAMGHDIHVYCVNTDPLKPIFETRSWKEENLQIYEVNHAYQRMQWLYDLQRVPHIEMIFRDWASNLNLDVIHVHHCLYMGMGILPVLAEYAPVLMSLHDYWPLDPRAQLFTKTLSGKRVLTPTEWMEITAETWPQETSASIDILNYLSRDKPVTNRQELMHIWQNYSKKCMQSCSALISPSKATADIFKANGFNQKIICIENGIQSKELSNKISEESEGFISIVSEKKPIRMTILGSIVPSKGQLAFCKACLEIADQISFKVNLHGPFPKSFHQDPAPQAELISICEEFPERFEAHGKYNIDTLRPILENSDLVVVPSIWEEVYGLVAREAYCYGLPIISTSAGGLNELNQLERVLLLDHTRPSSWGKQLLKAFTTTDSPLNQWISDRRNRIPPPDTYKIRSIEQCSRQINDLYLIHNKRKIIFNAS